MCLIVGGSPPPAVNEAHYLIKAKNFWDPSFLSGDVFADSPKAHVFFDVVFGLPTLVTDLETTAWIGRAVGWAMLAAGLTHLVVGVGRRGWETPAVMALWSLLVAEGNLAGEWVVGGIEAKVPAYGLVLAAIGEIARDRWSRVWPMLGLASAFHVLTGGWAVVAATAVWAWRWWRGQTDARFWRPALFVGGALSLLGVVPAAAASMGGGDGSAAAEVYVYYRIPHHLLPSAFHGWWYVRFAVLSAAAMTIAWAFRVDWTYRNDRRRSATAQFAAASLSITAAGLVVGMLPAFAPETAASLLRFYWFRLGDAAVPLWLAVAVWGWSWDAAKDRAWAALPVAVMFAVGLVGVVGDSRRGVPVSLRHELLGWDRGASPAEVRDVAADWIAVCDWCRRSTPPDEVFLTPRHQQTFKWYALRGEVVNWKDVPQDPAGLVEWRRRMTTIFPRRLGLTRVTINYDTLRQYRRRYGVRFMVVDHRVVGDRLPLPKVYPVMGTANATYGVYELPR